MCFLGRRRAKILKEEQKEGTNIFLIEALLPVVESFGLSVELLTETSGINKEKRCLCLYIKDLRVHN